MNPVETAEGVVIARCATRVVHGGRGDYVEIADNDMIKSTIYVPEQQRYRLSPPWDSKVYYHWYETWHGGYKVYFQRKTVSYADYKIGHWYISPSCLMRLPC